MSERELKWEVEHTGPRYLHGPIGPTYYIAEAERGMELHVWLSQDNGLDEAAIWHWEIKGPIKELASDVAHPEKSLEMAKQTAATVLRERIEDMES